jgi:hypothetical protein
MRKLPVTKFLASLLVLLIITFSLAPAIVEARSGDGAEVVGSTAVVHYQEGEGEGEGSGSLAGTGIALGLIGFVLLILAVVAIIGAVSLGIIGLGYWQSESGD